MDQMSPIIDCTTEEGLAHGIEAAAEAIRAGALVVFPTDTVYGLGVDAFSPDAVTMALSAKGRGREMPPPVLIQSKRTVDGLATNTPVYVADLIEAFWPGPLTIILQSQSSLMWDLGETNGTVALRMPNDDVALRLLAEVGPMAVTSANVSGQPPATSAQDAEAQLKSVVSIYLDAGPRPGGLASTILDCSFEAPVILRAGAISFSQIQEVLGEIELGNQAGPDSPSSPASEDSPSSPTSEEPIE
jgi:L-threonylcarbamoyladenylate synthase